MKQLLLHKEIDEITSNGPTDRLLVRVTVILEENIDARRYFFTRASEVWFDWLSDNGFLEVVKVKSEDPTKYSYKTPELDYLVRVSEKIPARVADFMLSVPISADTFNPETTDRFLWICSRLPAEDIARMAPKIRDEQWVRLMGPFNRWGFEYKEMFEELAAANDHAAIVILAQAILLVRNPEEFQQTRSGVTDNPFFFNELHQTEVFEKLIAVDDANAEAALQTVTTALSGFVKTANKEDKVFDVGETFHLFDVDFFEVKVGQGHHYSLRDDVRDLAAAVKVLSTRLIGGSCGKPEEVRQAYERCIVPMPNSRTVWRLRLYIWSLCPEVFKEELKAAFFKAFESRDALGPITAGAEYEHALKSSFGTLSKEERKEYIQQAFSMLVTEENRSYGFGIFSSIYDFLSEDQVQAIEKVYQLPLKPDYSPEPSIIRGHAGIVVPQTPPNTEDVWAGPVAQIVEAMKTQWTPEQLHNLDKGKDFMRPINPEGVGDKMRSQMKERMREYTENALLFYDRDALDPHYTYSFLRGINEAIRANNEICSQIAWEQLIALASKIVADGTTTPFEFSRRDREKFDAWLAGWVTVHSSLADILEQFLRDENAVPAEQFLAHRNEILSVIDYLLTVPDPEPKDEVPETAGMQTQQAGGEMLVSDPFSIAINSARGQAFQAFVLFMEVDGRKYAKDAKVKIDADVLKIYQDLLARENTAALFFMYGHYLPFFYFRDVEHVTTLLPDIFTKNPAKEHLYLAAWEGYLTRALYSELFEQLQGEYKRAIELSSKAYPKRNYRADLDEALAGHLALAYAHFDDFTLESDLFKLFWDTPNAKRHEEFVSFLGTHFISRENPASFFKEHPEVKLEKLLQFWDWLLAREESPNVFAEFGFWMNTTNGLYNNVPALGQRIVSTLEKSEGQVDWEIKLMDSLPELASKAPQETLRILDLYLSRLDVSPTGRGVMHIDTDLVDVFKQLYKNPDTKDGTYELVDKLLPIGKGIFWQLKMALE